jgi:hypothetical protein
MNTELTTLTPGLPARIESVVGQPITSAGCLRLVESSAKTALKFNLVAIAAGILYVYTAAVLVPSKARRTSRNDVKAALAKAFGEPERPNANAGRTKRYELARLCVQISTHREMRVLATNAAKQDSLEAGVAYLAQEFSERAKSVAALARNFGVERQRVKKEPVKQPFLILLRALVADAERDQQTIPFADSVKVLAPAATRQDVTELVRHLLPHLPDQVIPELVDVLIRIAEHRRASAPAD